MKTSLMVLIVAALIGGCANTSNTAVSGVERMYVLYCGEGNSTDKSRWTPGVAENVNKPITLSNSCYVIKHAKGWMLWEAGYSESIVGNANGLPAGALHWYWRAPKSLTQQLADLGLKPNDIA